jgi:tripartite-type tricarboxylate transporter receptor subunit TctC
MQFTRRTLARALFAAAAVTAAPFALAQGAYPNKPVKIVVAFTAGGPTDVVARLIAQKLSDKWGQPVVVENRAGAAGLLGSELVAKAPADGYTLLMATAGNLTVNQHLYRNMRFDPVKDFTPIAQTAAVDFVLVSQPNASFRNVKELIAAAKARPEAISTATSGNGGAPHLAAALFEDAAKVDLQLVPYRGTAVAVNAGRGGQTHLDCDAASQVLPHIKAGKLKPLAVLGTKRSPLLPDVPTMAEAGLPTYNFSNWFGLVGPAGLPKDVQAKLEQDVAEVLRNSEIKARYQVMGLQSPVATTSAQFATLIQKDAAKWGATIKAAHIVAE